MLGAGGEKRQAISRTLFFRLGIWKTGNYGRGITGKITEK
jgi:hypothetical protein